MVLAVHGSGGDGMMHMWPGWAYYTNLPIWLNTNLPVYIGSACIMVATACAVHLCSKCLCCGIICLWITLAGDR